MNNYPEFRNYIEKNVITNYDDNLKIFLIKALKKVEYLKHLDDSTLVNVANLMSPVHREVGSQLFYAHKDFQSEEEQHEIE